LESLRAEGRKSGVSEVIHDRKAAIRNTIVYAIAFVLAVAGLATRKSILGYALFGIVILWSIGGLTENIRAIRHGFTELD
jgi:hypothetical protein